MSNLYVRKNGERVIVMGRPVAGQLRFVAAKRMAINGNVWWLAYDNEKGDWVRPSCPAYKISNKFKTRKECEAEIAKALWETKVLEFVPYDGEESPYKKGKHKYAVDVHWDFARSYEVEAESPEEAERIIQAKMDAINGLPTPEMEEAILSEKFEATGDLEVKASGEELLDGTIQYY